MERKNGFTLIELLLTIAIIVMAGGLLLMQTQPLLRKYQREQALAKLKRELLCSKRLSEAAHATVIFEVKKHSKGLQCVRKTDEPLNLPGAFKKTFMIPYLQLANEEEEVKITFYASGIILIGNQRCIEKNLIKILLGGEELEKRVYIKKKTLQKF